MSFGETWTRSQAAGAARAVFSPVGIVRGSATADGAKTATSMTASGIAVRALTGTSAVTRALPAATRAIQIGKAKIKCRGPSRSLEVPATAAIASTIGGTTTTVHASTATTGRRRPS